MKKSTLKIAAVLMCLATCLTAFAACSKNHDEELLYKENGKYYYRPEIGADAFELATNDNGETLVDEHGNLLWKVTNAAGEDQTHPVSMPDVLEEGNKVSCQQFTVEIPKGWKNVGKYGQNIMLRDEKNGFQINYSFYDGETAQQQSDQLKKVFEASIKEGMVDLEISDTQVSGRDAQKAVLKIDGEQEDSYMETYLIDTANGVMSFACMCTEKNVGKFDFKAFLDTIEYRI